MLKGVKTVKRILIIAVVLVLIIVVYKLLTAGPAIKPITNNIIKLRLANNPLDKAKIISSTDNLVNKINNDDVKSQWSEIIDCVNKGCSDKKYFDFLIVLFNQYGDKLARSDLLLNLLAVERYWGTDEVITFSKAMSFVDDEISRSHSKSMKDKWDELVKCNNQCEKENDLFFELIQLIVN